MNVLNKYSGEIIDQIQLDSRKQISEKIEHSIRSYELHKTSKIEERKKWISTIISTLENNKDYLVDLIVKEAGKPLFYAQNELDRCIRTAQLGLENFNLLEAQEISVDLNKTTFQSSHIKRFPIGVIFGISPFNFPLNLALHKIIPAIASGNTIIVKPSPYTPLSLKFLVEEVNKSIPEGILTYTLCSNEDAEYIATNETIKMVSFTGSDKVGWHIKSLIPKKKVALELGGNAAVYIDRTANLKNLAKTIAESCVLYAGQICISTQRIFVHTDIYDTFSLELIKAFSELSSGNPNDNVFNGPLIDEIHLSRLETWINSAVNSGGKILHGGSRMSSFPPLLAPTLIEHIDSCSELFQEEAFGPIAILQKVSSADDAIQAINNSRYGLQAGLFLNNNELAKHMFNRIDVGGIIINGVPGFRKDEMPYGGIKDSGFGREGIRYAMEEMTEIKLLIK